MIHLNRTSWLNNIIYSKYTELPAVLGSCISYIHFFNIISILKLVHINPVCLVKFAFIITDFVSYTFCTVIYLALVEIAISLTLSPFSTAYVINIQLSSDDQWWKQEDVLQDQLKFYWRSNNHSAHNVV